MPYKMSVYSVFKTHPIFCDYMNLFRIRELHQNLGGTGVDHNYHSVASVDPCWFQQTVYVKIQLILSSNYIILGIYFQSHAFVQLKFFEQFIKCWNSHQGFSFLNIALIKCKYTVLWTSVLWHWKGNSTSSRATAGILHWDQFSWQCT